MCISKAEVSLLLGLKKMQKHSTWPDYFLSMGVSKYEGNFNQNISI